jgi:ABC-type lipoprotein release transport system permease subunit
VTPIVVRLRSELRARWTSWLVVALLIGLGGGAALAAATGARRTSTAYPRLVKQNRGDDVTTGGSGSDVDLEKVLPQLQHLPFVADSSLIAEVAFGAETKNGLISFPELIGIASVDGRLGTTINRVKLLSGRSFSPHGTDEAVASFQLAERAGLEVGDSIDALTGDPSDPSTQGRVRLRIVGIVAAPGTFPAVGATTYPLLILSPSTYAAHRDVLPPPDSVALRFRHGFRDFPAFQAALKRLHFDPDLTVERVVTKGVQRSIRFEWSALWTLAALIALTSMALLGQTLSRQAVLESGDHDTLRALGVSRRQLFLLGMARAAICGLVGTAAAIVVAVLLTPLTPIGLARVAEPNPGLFVDGVALAVGGLVLFLAVLAIAALPAWHQARSASGALGGSSMAEGERPSVVAAAIARRSSSPSATVGVRMALESGRGRTSVPVRSTLIGVTLSLVAVAAGYGFRSSLKLLLESPRLAGFTYDAFIDASGSDPKKLAAGLRGDPDVAGFARGGFSNLVIGGNEMFGFESDGTGGVGYAIADGRAPRARNEIALANNTMRQLHARIGQTVQVFASRNVGEGLAGPRPMLVVGRAIIPPAPFGVAGPGEGAAITLDGHKWIDPTVGQSDEPGENELPFLVRFHDPLDPGALARLHTRLPGVLIFPGQPAGSLASLSRLAGVPLLLITVIAGMAVLTLAHTLISSIRRRRRDFAILKTLGFARGQVFRTIAWQATTVVMVGLVIGVPAGAASGRWAWRLFADQVGVVPAPVVPVAILLSTVPLTLILVNLLAFVPGRIAARMRPATVLRSE